MYRESKQAQNPARFGKRFASQQQKLHEMQQRGEALENKLLIVNWERNTNRLIEELSKLDYEFRLEQSRFMEEYNLP